MLVNKKTKEKGKEEFKKLGESDCLEICGGKSVTDIIRNGFNIEIKGITDLIK